MQDRMFCVGVGVTKDFVESCDDIFEVRQGGLQDR